MPRIKPFVGPPCLAANNARVAALDDFVQQQEGVAMGNCGKDFFSAHGATAVIEGDGDIFNNSESTSLATITP